MKACVPWAVALLPLASGCVRSNPAFELGANASGDDAADGATKPEDGDGGDAGATSGSTGTPGATSESVTSTADAETTEGVVDDGVGTTMHTTTDGGLTCSVEASPPFVAELAKGGNRLALPCATTTQITGTFANLAAPSTISLQTCPGGGCQCPGEEVPASLTLTDLSPLPWDVLDPANIGCVDISIAMGGGVGCEPQLLMIQPAGGKASFPHYIATNRLVPPLALPDITFGEVLEPCDVNVCEPEPIPGIYPLFFGDIGPIDPGTSAPVVLNPFSMLLQTYEVHNRFAYIDDACTTHAGWVAVHVPG